MYKKYLKKSFRKIFGCGLLVAFCSSAWAVDINRASAEDIAGQLRNIGLMKAHAIVAYRKQYGMFKTADDLQKIEGIGPRTVEMNRDKITVNKTAETNKMNGKMNDMSAAHDKQDEAFKMPAEK